MVIAARLADFPLDPPFVMLDPRGALVDRRLRPGKRAFVQERARRK